MRPGDLQGVGPRSHGFWYMDPWAASDVLIQLMFGLGAPDRGLAPGPGTSGLAYWVFPPDYEARLPAVLARASALVAEPARFKEGESLPDTVGVEGHQAVRNMDDDVIGHAGKPGGGD